MCAKLLQSCLTLCDSMDVSPPGSSLHGILQARILACVAIPSSRGSSRPGDQTCISNPPALAGRFSTTSTTLGSPSNIVKDQLQVGFMTVFKFCPSKACTLQLGLTASTALLLVY